jgi:phenylacetate-CoA ligase
MVKGVAFWAAADAVPTFRALGLDARSLDTLVRRRLSRLLTHASHSTSFYRQRLQHAGIDCADPILQQDPYRTLAALAPVSKLQLRQAGTQVLAGPHVRPEWRSSTSSGSTGEPFRVYYDLRAWASLKYLIKLRSRYACGVRPTDRVAILDAVAPGKRASKLEQVLGCARISILQPTAEVAAALSAFAPEVIYGLPSAILELAQTLRACGKRLPVRAVFTSGELLAGATRAGLAEAFEARIYDVYGTSETKEIAWECPHGGMHVNADAVRLEVLDDAGRSLPPGEEGNLVVTSLINRAMPLVRYLTGDRGALLPGSCTCGRSSPLLGVVTGRAGDVLVFRGGQRISPYALTCALERINGVLRYQVSQLDPARVRVRAILAGVADQESVAEQMRAALRFDVAPFLDADVEFVDRLPTGPGSKFRVVEPLVTVPDASLSSLG